MYLAPFSSSSKYNEESNFTTFSLVLDFKHKSSKISMSQKRKQKHFLLSKRKVLDCVSRSKERPEIPFHNCFPSLIKFKKSSAPIACVQVSQLRKVFVKNKKGVPRAFLANNTPTFHPNYRIKLFKFKELGRRQKICPDIKVWKVFCQNIQVSYKTFCQNIKVWKVFCKISWSAARQPVGNIQFIVIVIFFPLSSHMNSLFTSTLLPTN